jgi:hypothetical protein
MTFAPTFGSFGDFVTAVQLLRQLQLALRDVGGSSTRYQCLIKDIDAFRALISQVRRLVFSDMPFESKNALKPHVSLAEVATKTFLSRIGGYRASLSPGGTGRHVAESDMVAQRRRREGVQRSNEGSDDCDGSSFVGCKHVREIFIQLFGCNIRLICLSY